MRSIVPIVAVAVVLAAGLVFLLLDDEAPEPGDASSALTLDDTPAQDDEPAEDTAETPSEDRTSAPAAEAREPREGERTSVGGGRQSASPTPSITLRGRLVDLRGRGVGARVMLGVWERGSSAPLEARPILAEGASDRTGTYSLEVEEPPPGRFTLAVRTPGFADHDEGPITLPKSGEVELGDIVLRPGVIVQGRVLDDLSRAVGGAEVFRGYRDRDGTVRKAGLLSVTSARGEFKLNTLPAGPLLLVFEKEGYRPGTHEDLTSEPGERVLGVEVVLETGGSVSGRVVDPRGEPVPGAVVEAYDRDPGGERVRAVDRAGVGDDGSFELLGLDADATAWLRARASAPTRPPRWLTPPREAPPGGGGVTLVVEDAAAVELRVVEEPGGAALRPEALVVRGRFGTDAVRVEEVALEEGREWSPREDGTLRVARLPFVFGNAEHSLELEAIVSGRTAASRAFRALPGGTVELGELLLGTEGAVRVRVVDADGEPVADAEVFLEPWSEEGGRERLVQGDTGLVPAGTRSARTDSAGFARVPGPRGLRARLWARHPDHSPSADYRVTPAADGELLEVSLSLATAAVVRVEDRRGSPLAGRTVHQAFVRPGEAVPIDFRSAETDALGRARFDGLRPGAHRFSLDYTSDADRRAFRALNPDATPEAALEVRLAEGAMDEVVLVAATLVTLAGKVTQGGAPLPGATVTVYEDHRSALDAEVGFTAASELTATTDGGGEYSLSGLVPETYTVAVAHPTRAMPRLFDVTLADGNTRCDFPLELLRVRGRVLTPDGAPIAGARVRVERETGEEAEDVPDWMRAGLRDTRRAASEATTDANGAFELTGVDRTWMALAVEGEFVVPTRTEPFELGESELEAWVEVVTPIGGALWIALESPTGETGGWQAVAHAVGRTGRRASAPSPGDGSGIALEGLLAGRYRVECVRALAGGEPIVFEGVEIEPGRTTELSVRLP